MNLETTSIARPPVYFDRMIDAYYAGRIGRHAHLGHWDEPDESLAIGPQAVDSDAFEMAQARMNAEMIRMAHLTAGTRILDVACGFGGLIETLDDRLTDVDLAGVNIDIRQLEICQRLQSINGNALRWQEADACDLPFADETFDTLFCIEAMFHFASRERFLAEARRVLKPGGRLVLTDVVLLQDDRMPSFCFDAILNDGYGPWPDPWCELGDAATLIESSGTWEDIRQVDATQNTLPSYKFIAPRHEHNHRAPQDVAARSAMLLHWLHANHLLRYDYISAVAGVSL
ncbi:class I SAM-dependent methyltransferase [Fuerstiella marisgermanici]|uniref:Demethylrebeccamycin-D-glucose O-methyltransferase n=1 Tax=Fuerstiella marisgermanici TaxID=1891926 RepID=A0A1P8WC61_9PLAN|nr:class I SAM-dependent methyltransferase [Fuerstiella marisgermanici]APZ91651.1 Demethylrebeccamycin-D-glucose O-methyltransferase [Fuerstiella marisgermanici]